MTTDETDNLAMRMKRLDEAAVGEFAREFGPRLRRYFLRKGVAESEAESLAVSCVSDVWLKLERFTPRAPGGFEAWVFTLARNALIDDRRGAGQRKPLPTPARRIRPSTTTTTTRNIGRSPEGRVREGPGPASRRSTSRSCGSGTSKGNSRSPRSAGAWI